MKDNIVVIGGGGHAKVLISILKKNNDFSIIGYTDKKNCGFLLGIKYLGNDSILEELFINNKCVYAAIGIGQIDNKNKRADVIHKIVNIGFEFPSIVSKNSIVNEDVNIGKGTLVFDGAVINPGTEIGDFSIINTGAIIEHDCEIGDFTHIAPGAVLSGGVKIKNSSMVGAGATIIQYKEIGDNCIIGAGSVVTKNCIEEGTYIGIPARKI